MKKLMFLWSAILVAAVGQAVPKPGEWTTDISGVLKASAADGKLIAIVSANIKGCAYSRALEPVARGAEFLAWAAANGVYLVSADTGRDLDAEAALQKFSSLYWQTSLIDELKGYIYYPTFVLTKPKAHSTCVGAFIARSGRADLNGVVYNGTSESLIKCFSSVMDDVIDVKPEPEPEPEPDLEPDPEVETAVDLVPPTEPFAAPVATTMSGVVLAEDGSVAGVVQLKVGKASKKGESKVSLTLTGKDGKKLTAKAVSVQVGKGLQTVTFDIKNYGTLKLRLGADGFIGKSGAGGMIGTVDDEPATGPAAVALTLDEELPFADVLTEYLPTDITVERTAKKWTLPKAGKLKYVKPNAKKGIEGGLVATGENVSGLKLTYNAKAGTLKGSFKLWTFDEAKLKLKSVSVTVTGVVVDGVGYCEATYKKQKIGEFTVR